MGRFVCGPGGTFQSKTPVEEDLIFAGKRIDMFAVVRSADRDPIKNHLWPSPWLVSPTFVEVHLSRLLTVHRLCL